MAAATGSLSRESRVLCESSEPGQMGAAGDVVDLRLRVSLCYNSWGCNV